MSLVGAFPGIKDWRRRTIRQPINPIDKATVVSIYPRQVEERKCTIEPGLFIVPAGSMDKPGVLVVGPSSWWREIDEEQPLLEIPVGSIQIAESVVRDWANGIFGCNMGDSMPGWFYVAGAHTPEEIKEKYKNELNIANNKQRKWYDTLVNLADGLWARSQGNPLAISEDMRMAARELGVSDTKDWMKNFRAVNMVRCKACGSLKSPDYPICSQCRFPDPDHPMTKQLLDLSKQLPKQG